MPTISPCASGITAGRATTAPSTSGAADSKKQFVKHKEEEVEVQSAAVSPDGKTVTLKIDHLRPVMQMHIEYRLKAADGAKLQSSIWNTINVVGNQRGEVHVGDYKVVEMKK